MAKVYGIITNHFGGRYGKDLILGTWKGINYVRSKPVPTYRRTYKQARVRNLLKEAVAIWQGLSELTQYVWRAASYGTGMSGYELFISQHIKSNW